MSFHVTLITLRGWYDYYPRLADGNTEAPGGFVTWPRSEIVSDVVEIGTQALWPQNHVLKPLPYDVHETMYFPSLTSNDVGCGRGGVL